MNASDEPAIPDGLKIERVRVYYDPGSGDVVHIHQLVSAPGEELDSERVEDEMKVFEEAVRQRHGDVTTSWWRLQTYRRLARVSGSTSNKRDYSEPKRPDDGTYEALAIRDIQESAERAQLFQCATDASEPSHGPWHSAPLRCLRSSPTSLVSRFNIDLRGQDGMIAWRTTFITAELSN